MRRRRAAAVAGSIVLAASVTLPVRADAAVITFVGSTTATSGGGTTFVVQRPAEAAAGDLLVATVDVLGAPTITKPAGWLAIRSNANGTAMKQAMYYRFMTAAEADTYTWTFSRSKPAAGGIVAYSGVATINPILASSGRAASSSAPLTAPSIDVTVDGALLVAAFGVRTASTIDPPASMTERLDVAATGGTLGATSEIADEVQPVAGASGDRVATVASPSLGVGQLVALRPVAVGTAPTATDGTAGTVDSTSVTTTMRATDPEECQLTFAIVTPPSNGTLDAIASKGCKAATSSSPNIDTATVPYTPSPGFVGTDQFSFQASDGSAWSNPATVTITVRPLPPEVPVADETPQPVGSEDIADDPAIWVHPIDAAQSAVIGTSKSPTGGGLYVYDLAGDEIQRLGTAAYNNVDLRYGATLEGQPFDLVVATNKTAGALDIFTIDAATRQLTQRGTVPVATKGIGGLCMYHSPSTAKYYAFSVHTSGVVNQFELFDDGTSATGTLVRTFDVGSASEGCAADDDLGVFYVSEETRGVWRYGAEPDAGNARVLVDAVGTAGHLVADVEGIGIYHAGAAGGYLIVSSQGESTYDVYTRDGSNAYVGTFRVVDAGTVDGTVETDGLDVSNVSFGSIYPSGFMIAHDHKNAGGTASNFKFVAWDAIAQTLSLTIDTSYEPR